MARTRLARWASIGTSILFISTVGAQDPPYSGTYLITSGRYIECCGIVAGGSSQSLPNQNQSFVRLSVNPSNQLASMTFLRADLQTFFTTAFCPPQGPVPFTFDNGTVRSNRIEFFIDLGPGRFGSYTVLVSQTTLRIDGRINLPTLFCVDVPTQFSHSNVIAALPPSATVRMSEVEVCWNSVPNRDHQVQFRSALGTGGWVNLGAPIPGNGSSNCIKDAVPPGEPKRFYQVILAPTNSPGLRRAQQNKRAHQR